MPNFAKPRKVGVFQGVANSSIVMINPLSTHAVFKMKVNRDSKLLSIIWYYVCKAIGFRIDGPRVDISDNRRDCWSSRTASVSIGLTVLFVVALATIRGDTARDLVVGAAAGLGRIV